MILLIKKIYNQEDIFHPNANKMFFLIFILIYHTQFIYATSSNKSVENQRATSNINCTFENRDYENLSFAGKTNFTAYKFDSGSLDPKSFKVELSLEERMTAPNIHSIQAIPWTELDSTIYGSKDKKIYTKYIPIKVIFSNNNGIHFFLIEKNKELTMYDKELKIKYTYTIDELKTPLIITSRKKINLIQ